MRWRGCSIQRPQTVALKFFNSRGFSKALIFNLPETGQQRHPDHTLDDIQGTTPQSVYGLYFHAHFLALKAHLPKHIALQIIPEAMQQFEQNEQTVTLQTHAHQLSVDYLVQAIGHAETLLQQELADCYRACNLPYPGWNTLLQHLEDYSTFLADYLKTTKLSPNHPFAHLVRPVMSFYGQVKDLLPTVEQLSLLRFINRVKPLFATQSRACAELMLAALQAKRLTLMAGEFLTEQIIPTILQPDGTQVHPSSVILATGFASPIPLSHPPFSHTRCYRVTGTALSAVHRQATDVANAIVS